jgi:hypothetical protein
MTNAMRNSIKATPQGKTWICSKVARWEVIVGLTGWLAIIGAPHRGSLGEEKMDSL